MKNLSQYPIDQCPHCIRECDYIDFRKEIVDDDVIERDSEVDMISSPFMRCYVRDDEEHVHCSKNGQTELWNYYRNTNYTFKNKAFLKFGNMVHWKEEIGHLKNMMENSIIIHFRFMKPEIDFIDLKYTFMDKLAMFGGNFGIFEMISGWSLFGILNLILMICKWFFGFNKN